MEALTRIAAWSGTERERIELLSPEEFTAWLSGVSIQPAEKKVAGYSVRVTHSSDPNVHLRKRTIADVMLKSVRRMKEEHG